MKKVFLIILMFFVVFKGFTQNDSIYKDPLPNYNYNINSNDYDLKTDSILNSYASSIQPYIINGSSNNKINVLNKESSVSTAEVSNDKLINNYVNKPQMSSLTPSIQGSENLAIGKYGVSLPLYTFKSQTISVPLVMSISLPNNLVQEIGGWTGSNWDLSLGGSISRKINGGVADEKLNSGYFYSYSKIENPSTLSSSDFDNGLKGEWDMEPDEFSFNFLGLSGSFMFDKYRNIHITSGQDFKVSPVFINNEINEFIITDDKGFKYYFGGSDNSIEQIASKGFYFGWNKLPAGFVYDNGGTTSISDDIILNFIPDNNYSGILLTTPEINMNIPMEVGKNVKYVDELKESPVNISWKLKKIVDPNSWDYVDFLYDSGGWVEYLQGSYGDNMHYTKQTPTSINVLTTDYMGQTSTIEVTGKTYEGRPPFWSIPAGYSSSPPELFTKAISFFVRYGYHYYKRTSTLASIQNKYGESVQFQFEKVREDISPIQTENYGQGYSPKLLSGIKVNDKNNNTVLNFGPFTYGLSKTAVNNQKNSLASSDFIDNPTLLESDIKRHFLSEINIPGIGIYGFEYVAIPLNGKSWPGSGGGYPISSDFKLLDNTRLIKISYPTGGVKSFKYSGPFISKVISKENENIDIETVEEYSFSGGEYPNYNNPETKKRVEYEVTCPIEVYSPNRGTFNGSRQYSSSAQKKINGAVVLDVKLNYISQTGNPETGTDQVLGGGLLDSNVDFSLSRDGFAYQLLAGKPIKSTILEANLSGVISSIINADYTVSSTSFAKKLDLQTSTVGSYNDIYTGTQRVFRKSAYFNQKIVSVNKVQKNKYSDGVEKISSQETLFHAGSLNQVASTSDIERGTKISFRYNTLYDIGISNTGDGVYNDMANKNIIIPLEQIQYKDGKVLGAKVTTYRKSGVNLIVPYQENILEINKPINDYELSHFDLGDNELKFDNRMNQKITYEEFDFVGNLIQSRTENNIPTSYLWGYESRYLIAKVEGATYQEVMNTLTNEGVNIESFLSSYDGTYLMGVLNNLRNSLPQAMIISNIYKPLIGVSSITDPRGETIYYEYDSSNRLVLIKDSDYKVLKSFCYNYQGQVENCVTVISTPDTTAPSVPTGLSSDIPATTMFTLSWNASTDNVGIAGYKIYKNGGLYATEVGTAISLLIVGQTAGSTNTWTISAYDAAGNNSAQSVGKVVTQASSLPLPPENIVLTNGTQTALYFSWTVVSNADYYKIYRDGVWKSNVMSGTAGSTAGLVADTDYAIGVSGVNASGEGPRYTKILTTDPASPPTCLVAGTLITLPNGSQKLIEELAVGDNLKGVNINTLPIDETLYSTWSDSNPRITNTVVKIVGILPTVVQETISINNGLLRTTPDHLHLIKRAGTFILDEASTIVVGDILLDSARNEVSVVSVELVVEEITVYKVDVEKKDLFIANGMITHNMKLPL